MGCGMSTEEKEGRARNEEIENQLKKDRLSQRNEIKMLLLGEFGSGGATTATFICPFKTVTETRNSDSERQVLVNPANPPSSSR